MSKRVWPARLPHSANPDHHAPREFTAIPAVMSRGCGLIRLLLAALPRPTSGIPPAARLKPLRRRRLPSPTSGLCCSVGLAGRRDCALRVSAPLQVAPLEEASAMGSGVKEEAFDPGTPPPPFGLAEIWAAIPKHCWVKGPRQSMSYVVVVFGLAMAAA
ncbi:hypothetical protein BHM03_00028051 [Ensete ventricosum]|uniref:Fatty acid desaturase N-terminal domain-containing protein n=1 Tax=Ensete ventricosum TaxID=4639 RepID=A0A445MHX6_ENSVE|nr:hypothetical protein BHM03_00028051 [Ensete ventricosum]